MRRYSAFETILEDTDPHRALSTSTDGTYASDETLPPSTDDDELPNYEDVADDRLGTVPSYEEDRLRTPAYTFDLVCIPGKAQIFVDKGVDTDTRSVVSGSAFFITQQSKAFSKRVDISLHFYERFDATSANLASATKQCERTAPPDIAVTIDSGTKLPWMPRATLRFPKMLVSASNNPGLVSMVAPNQKDWQVKLGSRGLIWGLSVRPTSLLLVDRDTETLIARFIYSEHGIDAKKDQNIGRLEIYSDHAAVDDDDDAARTQTLIPVTLASCVTVVRYWKDMGRRHRNAVGTDTASSRPTMDMSRSSGRRNGSISSIQRSEALFSGMRAHAEIARRNSAAV